MREKNIRTNHAARQPYQYEIRAAGFTADELVHSLEWHHRARPSALRDVRRRYLRFRSFLLAEIERACRENCDADGEPG